MPRRMNSITGAEVCDRLRKLNTQFEWDMDIESGNVIETRRKFTKRNGNRRRSVRISKKVHTPRPCVPATISSDEYEDMEEIHRRRRRSMVDRFNEDYVYGAVNNKERGSSSSCDSRILIWSDGCDPLPVASSGITWVAVHGEDMICVVTKKNQHMDKARLCGDFLEMEEECILFGFMTTIAHEMEDPSSELRQRLKQVVKKIRSFAAVSMAPSIDGTREESGHEGSIPWPGKDNSVNFLKDKLKTDPALTDDETVQTAIYALEYLHQQDFSDGDILVNILMKGEQAVAGLVPEEIKEHLAVVHREPRV